MRLHHAVLVLSLVGCSVVHPDDTCGRLRAVTASGPSPRAQPADSLVRVRLADQDDSRFNFDGVSWDIPVSLNGDPITAIHLHDRTPGHNERIVYIFPDLDPGPGFVLSSTADYSYSTPITTLFELMRAGQTYLDIHTAAQPEGTGRADLTSVNVEDWSAYSCS